MRVLFVTTEMDDFVRVGGLAAVSAALPRALRPWSDVRIMLPGYRDVVEQFTHIEIVGQCAALAEMPAADSAARRPGTGCRFTCCYVLNCTTVQATPMAMKRDETGVITTFASGVLPPPLPNLRQAHWTGIGQRTSFTPTIGRRHSRRPTSPGDGANIPSILTIHNLAYQGLFPKESLRRIGAPENSFHIDGLEFYDKLSFLKGGIVYASHLTTVSATYAREITTRNLAVAWKACSGSAPTPRS